jgi:hypothetical protein
MSLTGERIAYIALPSVLSALDLKLSSKAHPMTPEENLTPLEAYTKTMKCFQDKFDGTEEVSSTVDRIFHEAETHIQKLSLQHSTVALSVAPDKNRNWYEIFVRYPRLHLRVAMAFDLSFSRGRFPKDEDFPRELRADRLDDSPKHSTAWEELSGDDSVDDVAPPVMLQKATKSPSPRNPMSLSRALSPTNLDFLELFAGGTMEHDVSLSADLDMMDGFYHVATPLEGDGDTWQTDIMTFFDEFMAV